MGKKTSRTKSSSVKEKSPPLKKDIPESEVILVDEGVVGEISSFAEKRMAKKRVDDLSSILKAKDAIIADKEAEVSRLQEDLKVLDEEFERLNGELLDEKSTATRTVKAQLMQEMLDGRSANWRPQEVVDHFISLGGTWAEIGVTGALPSLGVVQSGISAPSLAADDVLASSSEIKETVNEVEMVDQSAGNEGH